MAHSTSTSRSVLVTILLASPLTMLAGAVVVPVLEVIRGDLGVTGTAAGLILTTHGLAIAVTSPLVGRLIDRYGVRLPFAGGLILFAIGGGAGMFTTSYPALIASRVVLGVGAAGAFTGATVATLALYQGSVRDRVMGWRSTAMSVIGVAGPLAAGALGGISWHATFAIYLIGIPLASMVLLWLPSVGGSDGDGHDESGLGSLLRRPALAGLYGLIGLSMVLMYALAIFLPQRLAEIGIEAPFLVAIHTVVTSSVVVGLVGLRYEWLRARLADSKLLWLAVAGWVGAFLIFGTAGHPIPLLLGMALFGVSNGVFLPTMTLMVDEIAPTELRGRAASLIGTAIFTGQFTSPLMLGPLIGATAITTGFLAASALAGLILVGMLIASATRPTRPLGEAA